MSANPSDDRARGIVHVEETYRTTPDDLWEAITDRARLARWIAVVEGDLGPGGEFRAAFTSGWSGPGQVDACEPPRRAVVRLAPDTDEETTIEATITEVPAGVHLVVEERGIPVDELPAHVAGWRVHLADLGVALSGASPEPWEPRWRAEMAADRERAVAGR
jgi:uncharacterized protein YndB with AHSA1/START domain